VELRQLLMSSRAAPPAPPAAVDAAFALPPAALPWGVPFVDAGALGLARGLLVWGRKCAFCGVCGGAMLPVEGGVKRACGGHPAAHPPRAGCGERAYPRTDPVVIALVLSADGARALLGRGRSFPPGVFSCLAGFLEPGETLEQAVVREVAAEAGVVLEPARVAYAGSQPWPVGRGATVFGQLMLGAVASVAGGGAHGDGGNPDPPLVLDPDELAEARWVARADVACALRWHYGGPGCGDALRVPGPWAIAHNLLRAWVRGELPAAAGGGGGGGAA
jgi:NAD+ diphosphatase